MEQLQAELADFTAAKANATTTRLQALLDIHLKEIQRAIRDKETQAAAAQAAATAAPAPVAGVAAPLAYQTIQSYGWDETDKAVKLYISLPGCGAIQQSECSIVLTPTSMRFCLNNPATPRQLYLTPLCKEIITTTTVATMVKCKTNDVVVTLTKKDVGKWWNLLEKASAAKKSATPDAAEDPSAGLMKVMKQMYDDGDEEMKRTIGKAWAESREKQNAGLGL